MGFGACEVEEMSPGTLIRAGRAAGARYGGSKAPGKVKTVATAGEVRGLDVKSIGVDKP